MPPNPGGRLYLPQKDRIKNGRVFQVNKRTDTGVIYLRCRTNFCAGTAKQMPGGEIVDLHDHSAVCYEDRNIQLKADFTDALQSALKRNFWMLKQVYETVAAVFPREVRIEIPYNAIKSSLKRWRKQYYPPCPGSLELMAQELTNPEHRRLLEYDVGRLTCRPINDATGGLHLLLYDSDFVSSDFKKVSQLFVDGTFQTTPSVTGVYQLVSVLGVVQDHAIPLAHVLMSSKTQCAYTAVLSEVRSILPRAHLVAVIMADFEQALRNSGKLVFPNAIITGCSVHYDRALLKKIKSLRLTRIINENEEAKMFLKKLMVLAYLPEDLIVPQYEELKNALPNPLGRSLAAFILYYERQWIRIVKPAGFCVFGLSRRTNNVIESYNSVLADELGQHPSAWTFIGKLVKLTSRAREAVSSLMRHKTIKRYPRYSTIYRQKQLTNAWKQLRENAITPTEFVDRAATLKGHISQRLMRIPDDLAEDAVELDQTPDNYNLVDPDFDAEIIEVPPRDDFGVDEPAPQADAHESDLDDSSSSSIHSEAVHETDDENLEVQQRDYEGDEIAMALPDLPELDDSIEEAAYDGHHDEPLVADVDLENLEEEEGVALLLANGGNPASGAGQPSVGGQEPNPKASASRKRNLRKKRMRQAKARIEEREVRPYGHKRRRKTTGQKCVVCLRGDITHGFIPCGHFCCCQACSIVISDNANKKCPKCRAHFDSINRIFTE